MNVLFTGLFSTLVSGTSADGRPYATVYFVGDDNKPYSFKLSPGVIDKVPVQMGAMCNVYLRYYNFRDQAGKQVAGFKCYDIQIIQ